MSDSPSFLIYNASAGSGKTFSLVKTYLKKILCHPYRGYFKHFLAITFTNKAVAEMKERIISTLVGFSLEETPLEFQGMFNLILKETSLTKQEINDRSKKVLKHLLHHYAQFSVETIDHFNHRLIRTFAKDLNLAANFEVRLDVQQLIDQAVDQLINRAGNDQAITDILLEFALQKTDEDKSWDIAIDLKKAASLLTNENDALHLEQFKEKKLSDFLSLRKDLRKKNIVLSEKIKETAQAVLERFSSEGIPLDVFSRETLPNHFKKLIEGNYNVYTNKLEENIAAGGSKIYKANTPSHIASAIDMANSFILDSYRFCKSQVAQLDLIKNILKNLVPLATINLVQQELELIKEEENILPINEFNALINSQIKDQPTPFIYERLGDRYRHFFIDEFQDTSALQWNNLVPLIDNAISQGYEDDPAGSLLIVGDAKQSIYRWRGGLPEQFMQLYGKQQPFSISEEKIKEENLGTNYRSCQEIIDFNNQFFSYLAHSFGDLTHRELYEIGNQQKYNAHDSGFVQIEFVEATAKTELDQIYPQKVWSTIEEALKLGFNLSDICLLTRKKKDGITVSEFLIANKVAVISDETLLLRYSPLVKCMILVLWLDVHPHNEEVKIELLEFLYDHLNIQEEKHDFFFDLIKKPLSALSEILEQHSIYFSFHQLQFLSLYESCEYVIEQLKLAEKADAFLSSFMELVFNFCQQPEVGKTQFLEYWDTEKEKASLSASKNTNAVSVMTIHKSKGLEFPVVIFPYADIDLYKEIDPVAWYPWKQDGFNELLINFKKDIASYGEIGEKLVAERRNTLELDNLNLLYVALTRPEQQLYIFAQDTPLKSDPTTYNGFLKSYLQHKNLWKEDTFIYSFGNFSPVIAVKPDKEGLERTNISYIVSRPQSHQIRLVPSAGMMHGEETLRSIQIGNLLHDTMAKIRVESDLELVLEELKAELPNDISTFSEIQTMVLKIVTHPELNSLFQISEEVYNERDIITPHQIIRPDRINIHPDKTATLIDYKTGDPKEAYVLQISGYAAALQDMGYRIREKLLVYCNSEEIIINKT